MQVIGMGMWCDREGLTQRGWCCSMYHNLFIIKSELG